MWSVVRVGVGAFAESLMLQVWWRCNARADDGLGSGLVVVHEVRVQVWSIVGIGGAVGGRRELVVGWCRALVAGE